MIENMEYDNFDEFGIEIFPIIAFGRDPYAGKNSRLARSERSRRQRRDRYGRFAFMFGKMGFDFIDDDGNVSTELGTYVGPSNEEGFLQIFVENSPKLGTGIFNISEKNASQYIAGLTPEQLKKAGITVGKDADGKDITARDSKIIPKIAGLNRQDAPEGWSKDEDGSYVSDDNAYKISPPTGKSKSWSLAELDEEGNAGKPTLHKGLGAALKDVNERDTRSLLSDDDNKKIAELKDDLAAVEDTETDGDEIAEDQKQEEVDRLQKQIDEVLNTGKLNEAPVEDKPQEDNQEDSAPVKEKKAPAVGVEDTRANTPGNLETRWGKQLGPAMTKAQKAISLFQQKVRNDKKPATTKEVSDLFDAIDKAFTDANGRPLRYDADVDAFQELTKEFFGLDNEISRAKAKGDDTRVAALSGRRKEVGTQIASLQQAIAARYKSRDALADNPTVDLSTQFPDVTDFEAPSYKKARGKGRPKGTGKNQIAAKQAQQPQPAQDETPAPAADAPSGPTPEERKVEAEAAKAEAEARKAEAEADKAEAEVPAPVEEATPAPAPAKAKKQGQVADAPETGTTKTGTRSRVQNYKELQDAPVGTVVHKFSGNGTFDENAFGTPGRDLTGEPSYWRSMVKGEDGQWYNISPKTGNPEKKAVDPKGLRRDANDSYGSSMVFDKPDDGSTPETMYAQAEKGKADVVAARAARQAEAEKTAEPVAELPATEDTNPAESPTPAADTTPVAPAQPKGMTPIEYNDLTSNVFLEREQRAPAVIAKYDNEAGELKALFDSGADGDALLQKLREISPAFVEEEKFNALHEKRIKAGQRTSIADDNRVSRMFRESGIIGNLPSDTPENRAELAKLPSKEKDATGMVIGDMVGKMELDSLPAGARVKSIPHKRSDNSIAFGYLTKQEDGTWIYDSDGTVADNISDLARGNRLAYAGSLAPEEVAPATEEVTPDVTPEPAAPEAATPAQEVELDLNGDVKAQIEKAIADGNDVVFYYKGSGTEATRRVVTPDSIWTNPQTGLDNFYGVQQGEDKKKNFTISKMENAPQAEAPSTPESAPVDATPEVTPETNPDFFKPAPGQRPAPQAQAPAEAEAPIADKTDAELQDIIDSDPAASANDRVDPNDIDARVYTEKPETQAARAELSRRASEAPVEAPSAPEAAPQDVTPASDVVSEPQGDTTPSSTPSSMEELKKQLDEQAKERRQEIVEETGFEPIDMLREDTTTATTELEADTADAPTTEEEVAEADAITPTAEETAAEAGADLDLITTRTTDEDYADEAYLPTEEQRNVIDATVTGLDVAVQALAGSGKTSTLVLASKRMLQYHPDKKILYIAFNKTVQLEAGERMPKENTEARTGDSLAWWGVPAEMRKKIGKGHALPRDVADDLGIPTSDKNREDTAIDTMRVIEKFSISDSPEISKEHFDAAGVAFNDKALAYAQMAWADLNDPQGKIKYTFSHNTKIWALTEPDLSESYGGGKGSFKRADVIFFDEAQDINPVMAKVIRDQDLQKIYVGDSRQAIYGFRGADNELDNVDTDIVLPMTRTFRFGQTLAGPGNRMLSLLNSPYKIIGAGKTDGEVVEAGSMNDADAVLTRSNGGRFAAIIEELNKGRVVGILKNDKADAEAMIATVKYLQGNGNKPYNFHEDLDGYKTWAQVEVDVRRGKASGKVEMIHNIVSQYPADQLSGIMSRVVVLPEKGDNGVDTSTLSPLSLNDGASGEFLPKINYSIKDNGDGTKTLSISGFGTFPIKDTQIKPNGFKWDGPNKAWSFTGTDADITSVSNKVRGIEATDAPEVDVLVLTAHKSKGLEWGKVRIGDDFRGPEADDEGNLVFPEKQELNLAYVALTRGQDVIDPGSLAWVYDFTDDTDEDPNTPSRGLPEGVIQDGQPVAAPEAAEEAPAEPETVPAVEDVVEDVVEPVGTEENPVAPSEVSEQPAEPEADVTAPTEEDVVDDIESVSSPNYTVDDVVSIGNSDGAEARKLSDLTAEFLNSDDIAEDDSIDRLDDMVNTLRDETANRDAFVILDEDGIPAGVMLLRREFRGIEMLYVDSVYTRKSGAGAGTVLMQKAAQIAKDENRGFGVLGSVQSAKPFYARLGGMFFGQPPKNEDPDSIRNLTRFGEGAWSPEDRDALAAGTPVDNRSKHSWMQESDDAPQNWFKPAAPVKKTDAPLITNDDQSNLDPAPAEAVDTGVEGVSSDPQDIADTYDNKDLKDALVTAVQNDEPGILIEGTDGNVAVVPVENVRDALQKQGTNTNDVIDEALGEPVVEPVPAEIVSDETSVASSDPMKRFLLNHLMQTREAPDEHKDAIYQIGSSADATDEQMDWAIDILNEQPDLLNVKGASLPTIEGDLVTSKIVDPGQIIEAIELAYPEAKTLSATGDLIVHSETYTDKKTKTNFRYELGVVRTSNELFYVYARETNLSTGQTRSRRVSPFTHSAKALNNDIIDARLEMLAPNTKKAKNLTLWFGKPNSKAHSLNIQDEGQIDVGNGSMEPIHRREEPIHRDLVEAIKASTTDQQVSEQVVESIYRHISQFGVSPESLRKLQTMQDIDEPTFAKIIDTLNAHVSVKYKVRTYGTYVSDDGRTPVDNGDLVIHTHERTGFQRLGRVVRRQGSHWTKGYGYTDYLEFRPIEGTNPDGSERLGKGSSVTSKNLTLKKTAQGTDGSERQAALIDFVNVPVSKPAITLPERKAPMEAATPAKTVDIDRSNATQPTVEVDGEATPAAANRTTNISEYTPTDVDAAQLQVGDYFMTMDPELGLPRLAEVISVDADINNVAFRITAIIPNSDDTAKSFTQEWALDEGSMLSGQRMIAYRKPAVEPEFASDDSVQELLRSLRAHDISFLDSETAMDINDFTARYVGGENFTQEEIDALLGKLSETPLRISTPTPAATAVQAAQDIVDGDSDTGDAEALKDVADEAAIKASTIDPIAEPTSPEKLTGYTVLQNDRGVYYPDKNILRGSDDFNRLRRGEVVPPALPFVLVNTPNGDVTYYDGNGERRWGQFGAAGAVLRTKNDDGSYSYFLAKRTSTTSTDPNKWSVPGGAHDSLDDAQNLGVTAKREMSEELGIDVSAAKTAGNIKKELAPDWAYDYSVLEVDKSATDNIDLSAGEVADTGWFTADEIRGMFERGELHSGFDSELLENIFSVGDAPADEADVVDTIQDNTDLNLTGFSQVGRQGGSNPGGTFRGPDGTEYYVKFQRSPMHAANEVAAAALYNKLGVTAPAIGHGTMDGKRNVTHSGIIERTGATPLNNPELRKKIQEGFAIDAWLANWDAVLNDNTISDKDGNPVRVDVGGSLLFRAQGGDKGSRFGDVVGELDSLRDSSMNSTAAAVYGSMTDAELKDSARKLLGISDAEIDSIVDEAFSNVSPANKADIDKLKATLKARRQYILNKYGITDGGDNGDGGDGGDGTDAPTETPDGGAEASFSLKESQAGDTMPTDRAALSQFFSESGDRVSSDLVRDQRRISFVIDGVLYEATPEVQSIFNAKTYEYTDVPKFTVRQVDSMFANDKIGEWLIKDETGNIANYTVSVDRLADSLAEANVESAHVGSIEESVRRTSDLERSGFKGKYPAAAFISNSVHRHLNNKYINNGTDAYLISSPVSGPATATKVDPETKQPSGDPIPLSDIADLIKSGDEFAPGKPLSLLGTGDRVSTEWLAGAQSGDSVYIRKNSYESKGMEALISLTKDDNGTWRDIFGKAYSEKYIASKVNTDSIESSGLFIGKLPINVDELYNEDARRGVLYVSNTKTVRPIVEDGAIAFYDVTNPDGSRYMSGRLADATTRKMSQEEVNAFIEEGFVAPSTNRFSESTNLFLPPTIGYRYDGQNGAIQSFGDSNGAVVKIKYYQEMDGADIPVEMTGYLSGSDFVSDTGFEISLSALDKYIKDSRKPEGNADSYIEYANPETTSTNRVAATPEQLSAFSAQLESRVDNADELLKNLDAENMTQSEFDEMLSYLDENGVSKKTVAKATILFGAHMSSVPKSEREFYASAADEVFTDGSARGGRAMSELFDNLDVAFEAAKSENLPDYKRTSSKTMEVLATLMPEIDSAPRVVSSDSDLVEDENRPTIYRGVSPTRGTRASTLLKDWAFNDRPWWGGDVGGKAAGAGQYFSSQYSTARSYANMSYAYSPDRNSEQGRLLWAQINSDARPFDTDDAGGGKKGGLNSMKKAGYIWFSSYLASMGYTPGSPEFNALMNKYKSQMFDYSFFPAIRGYDYSRLPDSDGRWVIYNRGAMTIVDPTPKRGKK